MLLSAVSVLVDAQSSSEIPGGLMNNPVQWLSIYIIQCRWYIHHGVWDFGGIMTGKTGVLG